MTDLMFTHASLDTFLPDAENEEDVDRLASNERMWITLTETGEDKTIRLIERVVGKRYQVVNPDAGDIAFLVHRDIEVRKTGATLAVPTQRTTKRLVGHGPRFVSWVQMVYDGQVITHHGVHLVRVAHGVENQVHQLEMVGQSMARFGKGSHIATGSGDLNGILPNREDLQAVMDRYRMTTTAVETGNLDPTHDGHRIDYVWTRDADGRLVVEDMSVRQGPKWHSDHDPIDVWARVRGAS